MPLDAFNALTRQRALALRGDLSRAAASRPPGAPVTLELGCGHGHFLTALAQTRPERLCLGVDLLADRLARAARKSARAGLKNIHWLQADALALLDNLPPELAPDEVFALFPDPWPKRRHWKNRLLAAPLLDRLADKLPPGARLFFRTDHAPYFDAARRLAGTRPEWEIRPASEWPFELETVFQKRAAAFQSLVLRLRHNPPPRPVSPAASPAG
ncbi:MAG: methyltransferase domain-containing protein [Opitutaceae bacterium]|jgi:tRNA (guanine-N7-)-methyltransferase|nr:methyltransferase domain-containing protein [Opitutaceae bacterium]